ncbi:carbonic anhydrase family protein [Singulisphaera rosea]
MASASTVSVGIGAATRSHVPARHGLHADQSGQTSVGVVGGTVTNGATGRGMARVRIQLLDANGVVIRQTLTNARGNYAFRVPTAGAYVIREMVPGRFVQTSPTFNFGTPTGSMAPGFGSSSWNYTTGNSDPTLGPVGVYFWDTVSTGGDRPFQSPIDINVPPVDLSQFLSINYAGAVPSQIVNDGHELQLQFSSSTADSITVGGQPFQLAQFHFHDPSEHLVAHQGFTMEEHFVNVNASGAISVVAVFLQLGAHNNALQPILDTATAHLATSGTSTPGTSAINFAGLIPSSLQGWFYQGSLTTPPLSQPVNFFVLSTPMTMDFQQLKQYEAVASGSGFLPNNRPIQPLDGRQLNQFTYNVNFQGPTMVGLNFTNVRRF